MEVECNVCRLAVRDDSGIMAKGFRMALDRVNACEEQLYTILA